MQNEQDIVLELNRTRFERITFRSGGERATVAPAVLIYGAPSLYMFHLFFKAIKLGNCDYYLALRDIA